MRVSGKSLEIIMGLPKKNKTNKKNYKINRILHSAIIFASLLIIFILGPYLFYTIYYMGRVYPNIYIAGIDVSGKTELETEKLLEQRVSLPNEVKLSLQSNNYILNTKDTGLNYDPLESAQRAYNFTRTGNIILDTYTRLFLLTKAKKFGLILDGTDSGLANFISDLSDKIDVAPIYPSIQYINGVIQVNKGVEGNVIDTQKLKAQIEYQLAYSGGDYLEIPTVTIDPTLNITESESAKIRASQYLGKTLTLKLDKQNYTYSLSDILSFLNPKGGYNDSVISNAADAIAAKINREPQDPKFDFNGIKVTEFQPSENGISLNKEEFMNLLSKYLEELPKLQNNDFSFELPVNITPPNITTDQINNLGINELLGTGHSTYFHSIAGRVFNINLAASKINGTLVKPGDTFSFNQTLGDVSKFTGYQQAYIISNGRTVLGDGGGVCQVSTTLFRAALNAGLPIIERVAHAYRVGYYEQDSPPGIDATVYAPEPDFKFKNDTSNYILIEARNNSSNYTLDFEIYGTNDGRVSSVSTPAVTNITPPLPTIYQDDPTLPNGTLKQTDFAASGAKVTFNYRVTRNGETLENQTFVSNYQPWAAVYLRGTKI